MDTEIITCPAPLDMLRRGSPVHHHDGIGVVCYISGGSVGVFNDWLGVVRDRHPTMLKMDLTDSTGRDHADRWIARRVLGFDCAAHLKVTPHVSVGQRHIVVRLRWLAEGWPVAFGVGVEVIDTRDIPGLADLDDERLLPDGSSVLAALVRRALVQHLIAQRATP